MTEYTLNDFFNFIEKEIDYNLDIIVVEDNMEKLGITSFKSKFEMYMFTMVNQKEQYREQTYEQMITDIGELTAEQKERLRSWNIFVKETKCWSWEGK